MTQCSEVSPPCHVNTTSIPAAWLARVCEDDIPAVVLPPPRPLTHCAKAGCLHEVPTLTPPLTWAPGVLSSSPPAEGKLAWWRERILSGEDQDAGWELD